MKAGRKLTLTAGAGKKYYLKLAVEEYKESTSSAGPPLKLRAADPPPPPRLTVGGDPALTAV